MGVKKKPGKALRTIKRAQRYFTSHFYLIVHQELWSLEVPGGDTDVVLLSRVVELRQTPVDQSQLQIRQKLNM